MSTSSFKAVALLALVAARAPRVDYGPSAPPPPAPPAATGAIFQPSSGYAPLTSGARAGAVGDVLTIVLVEHMQASKSAGQTTDRSGSIGLSPPTSGPLALFSSADVGMGGSNAFKGAGQASQTNALSGEISVTIAAVYANGTMLVRGEKALTLNRGDEQVRLSGIVRAADIGPDNRVASTRVADAHIAYTGRGEVARASRQGWLQRFFSAVSPF